MYSIVGWQVLVCFKHLWHTVIPVDLSNKTDNLMEHNLVCLIRFIPVSTFWSLHQILSAGRDSNTTVTDWNYKIPTENI